MGGALSAPITTQHISRYNSLLTRGACIHLQGFRESQEDNDTFLPILNESGIMLYAIYDGHGGPKASHFLHSQVPHKFAQITNLDDQDTIAELILQLDDEFLNTGAPDGSTACLAFVQPWNIIDDKPFDSIDEIKLLSYEDKKTKVAFRLLACNIGDSRSLIIRRPCIDTNIFNYEACTEDHKPNNIIESQRITLAGGFVQNNRVDGNLALSRAFGDREYKTSHRLPPHQQKIIAVPDFETFLINYGDILIVACDGIFEGDLMTNHHVCELTYNKIKELQKPFQDTTVIDYCWDPALIGRHLIEQSLCESSKDNNSVMVISFTSLPDLNNINTTSSNNYTKSDIDQINHLIHLPQHEIIPGPHSFVSVDDNTFYQAYQSDFETSMPLLPEIQQHIKMMDQEINHYLNNYDTNNLDNNSPLSNLNTNQNETTSNQSMIPIPVTTLSQYYSIPPIAVTAQQKSISQPVPQLFTPNLLEILLAHQNNLGYDQGE